MKMLLLLFWISLGTLFYCYIGYGLLLLLFNQVKRWIVPVRRKRKEEEGTPVSLVVTAYNEEAVLRQKIENILQLDYPADLLQVIVVTDGSADGSEALIRQHPFITLLHQPERKGKYAAIKRAMQIVRSPVVVFSDANALLNRESIRRMVAHYSNEKVGGVAGEKKILYRQVASAVGQAEGWYWQYESFLKRLDAGLYSVVGAAGELFSIRTSLFRELPDDVILDDFVISMQVCLQGYKIEYEPGAFAAESPSASLAEEEKRKVRISAGAYQSIGYVKDSLRFFRYPLLTIQFFSRRILRWVFCPLMLVILLASNILLAGSSEAPVFFHWALYAQFVFYGGAMLGGVWVSSGKRAGLLTIPFYFVFMNYCLAKGLVRYFNGHQTVLWEKSLRQALE